MTLRVGQHCQYVIIILILFKHQLINVFLTGWMAPEALQYHIYSVETDCFAFGIVLWEIATLGMYLIGSNCN